MRELSKEEICYFWLARVIGGKTRLFDRLLEYYGCAANAFEDAGSKSFSPPKFVNGAVRVALSSSANEQNLFKYESIMRKRGIGITTYISPDYPPLLKEIHSPARALFYRGILEQPKLSIAVVGTRRATEYGLKVAEHIGRSLVENGVCVISGLALGIDCTAARGALSAKTGVGCPTIAVIGSGLDEIYPMQNEGLFHEIAERGLVLSEYPPSEKPLKHHFPERNRIIAGLSQGVVVVEAPKKSGALITADLALECNRDVFCVPGRITDEMSEGPNALIGEGAAKPISCVADILIEYNIVAKAEKPNSAKKAYDESELTGELLSICKQLELGDKTYDDLCETLGFSHSTLNSALTYLEFSGIIKQLPGREYILC